MDEKDFGLTRLFGVCQFWLGLSRRLHQGWGLMVSIVLVAASYWDLAERGSLLKL